MKTKLVESSDILGRAPGLQLLTDSMAGWLVVHVLRLNKLDKLYAKVYDEDPVAFLDRLLEALGVSVEVSDEDLQKIPAEGPFITVSNHPFGGLDGIILLKLLARKRPDYRVMANFLLKKIEPVREFILGIEPVDNRAKVAPEAVKAAIRHVKDGKPLGLFPAGDVSTYQAESNHVEDRAWDTSVLKLVKIARVPVIPIYFKGTNSFLFYLLGLIHPMLRTVKLPSELLNKKNRVVRVRVGNPIDVGTQASFHDVVQYGKFLRAKTYMLGSALEVKKFFHRSQRASAKVEPVVAEVVAEVLREEVKGIAEDCLLFRMKTYEVYCAPSFRVPNVLNEIGRLREITFRAVGEGTNRGIDLDEYDLYYYHLFIWDTEASRIVGAYRVGKGKEIIDRYGMKGFYIHSLFKMRKEMLPILYESIELGRSFVAEAYQRKPLPLFLLWKGLLYFLLKNPEYRYLVGPVTISGRYTEVSKELIMRFIKANYYNEQLARYVLPRSRYEVHSGDPGIEVMLDVAHKDIAVLDKMVGDIEPSSDKLPILLKKYISLNAKIIGFNIDPKFNMCLDGLLILDIFDVPMKTIESLSKEINDDTILARFSADSVEI